MPTPAPAAHCAWQRVGHEMVVVDLDARIVRGLNAVGAFIWERLEKGMDVGAITDAVCDAYRPTVDRAQVAKDVDAFVAKLRGLGIVS